MFDQDWDNLRTAHDTAIRLGDLEMAERVLAATWLYAQSHNRPEHGEWADRTIELAPPNRTPSPDTFAHAAWWAEMREEHARARALRARGREQVSDPYDVRALLCVCHEFPVPDRHPLYGDPATAIAKLEPTLDLDRDWWLLVLLFDHGTSFDRASAGQVLARLVETAQRVRAPSLMVETDLALARHAIGSSPPDFATARDLATRATQTAVVSGNVIAEAESRRVVALAAVGMDPTGALQPCHAALVAAYEIRYWYRVWHVSDSAALALASSGNVEAASMILGHLSVHRQPFGMEHELGFEGRTRGIVRSHPNAEEWMRTGSDMTRYEIVDYSLEQLTAAMTTPP